MWPALKAFFKIVVYVAVIFGGLLALSEAVHRASLEGSILGISVGLLGVFGVIGVLWRKQWQGKTLVISLLVLVLMLVLVMAAMLTITGDAPEMPRVRLILRAPSRVGFPPPPSPYLAAEKKVEATATRAANDAVGEYRKIKEPENKTRAFASAVSRIAGLRQRVASK